MFVLFEKKCYFCNIKISDWGRGAAVGFSSKPNDTATHPEAKKHEILSNPSLRYFPLSQGWNTSILRVGQQQDAGWDKVN